MQTMRFRKQIRATTLTEVLVGLALGGMFVLLIAQLIRWMMPYTARLSESLSLQAQASQLYSRLQLDCAQRVPGGMWARNQTASQPLTWGFQLGAPQRGWLALYRWTPGRGLARYEPKEAWLTGQEVELPDSRFSLLSLPDSLLSSPLEDVKPLLRWEKVSQVELALEGGAAESLGRMRLRVVFQSDYAGRAVTFAQGFVLP